MDNLILKLQNMSGLETINEKVGYIYFSICKSCFNNGYTVVCSHKNISEHFSNEERVANFINSFRKK